MNNPAEIITPPQNNSEKKLDVTVAQILGGKVGEIYQNLNNDDEAVFESIPKCEDDFDEKAEKAAKAKREKEKKLTPEQQTAYDKAQAFLRSHVQVLSFFASDSSLNYKIQPKADTFSFEPMTHTVNFPLKWFAKDDYSDEELLFACLHELSHFRDMRKNPDGFLETFDLMQKDAEELAKDFTAKHPGHKFSQAKIKGYFANKLHTLYNCLDDIYVNNLVYENSEKYNQESGRKSVHSLYKKLGFEKSDLTQDPESSQYIFSLLRDAMLGDSANFEKSQVTPEVQKKQSKKMQGANDTAGFIEKMLMPARTFNKKGEDIAADPSVRHTWIRTLIQPIYVEMVKVDLEKKLQEPKPPKPPKPQTPPDDQGGEGGGSGDPDDDMDEDTDPGDDSGDDSGNSKQDNNKKDDKEDDQEGNEDEDNEDEDNEEEEDDDEEEEGGQDDSEGDIQKNTNKKSKKGKRGASENGSNNSEDDPFDTTEPYKEPGHTMTQEEINDIIKNMKEAQKFDEMDEAEQAEYKQEKTQQAWDQENGITPMERKIDTEVRKTIDPLREEMRKFWDSLIGKAMEYELVTVHEQTKGRLYVPSVINHFADLENRTRSGDNTPLEIYDQKVLEKNLVQKPERIEVSIVLDCSGSMNGERMQVARETTALLLYSLIDFNQKLRLTHATNLQTDSEVLRFGSEGKVTKHFKKETGSDDADDKSICRALGKINSDLGGTCPSISLNYIRGNMTKDDERKIKEEKLIKIVFVVTDGDSDWNTPPVLKSLSQSGVFVVSFLVGSDVDKDSFNNVWNNKANKNNRGIYIGNNVKTLPSQLMDQLSSLLGNITF